MPADTVLARGYGASSVHRSDARGAFEEAVRTEESPEALDGLGRSLWWLHKGREAIVVGSEHTRGPARRGPRPCRSDCLVALARACAGVRQQRCGSWLAGASGAPQETPLSASSRVGLTSRASGRLARVVGGCDVRGGRAQCAPAAGDPDLELQLAQLGLRACPRERSMQAWHSSMRRWPRPRAVSLPALRLCGHLLHADAGVRASR